MKSPRYTAVVSIYRNTGPGIWAGGTDIFVEPEDRKMLLIF